jgi:pimeloyl-ACP methyl ester carboxylesterase
MLAPMRWNTAALCLVVFALASCGGNGDDVGQPTITQPTSADASAVRQVTAQVDGRTLSGHCRGSQGERPAVVLEVGIGALQDQLEIIEEHVADRTVVCAYERAGIGASDPPQNLPRPLADVVSDLDAFIAGAKIEPPYVLVGQSAGGTIVFRYAQAHPDTVAGFVSMNPVPPSETFLAMARRVETKGEFANEVAFEQGQNDEEIIFTESERMLTDPLPSTLPYAVLFDEDCDGDTEFCRRILPPLTQVTKMLASVGAGGRFVRAKDAGHEIFGTRPELVYKTIDDVLNDAAGG